MKVALEKGETLSVAILENDRVVGVLNLKLSETEEKAPKAPVSPKARGGKRKRNISAEARRKMAEAQKRRWDKYRATKAKAGKK
jgi:hypothetical protein